MSTEEKTPRLVRRERRGRKISTIPRSVSPVRRTLGSEIYSKMMEKQAETDQRHKAEVIADWNSTKAEYDLRTMALDSYVSRNKREQDVLDECKQIRLSSDAQVRKVPWYVVATIIFGCFLYRYYDP
jgi:hypothetical protein